MSSLRRITTRRHGRRTTFAVSAALALALVAPIAVMAKQRATSEDCPKQKNTKCVANPGTQTAGGNGSVSHEGWPKINGIRWQVIADGDKGETRTGTKYSDELLGRNGSDHLSGAGAADVLWGDSSATLNGTKQHDVIDGGPGADWIYASHGSNTISGGSGGDHITGFYGHGTIDCGSGHDTVTLRGGKRHYTLHHCEKIKHP